MKYRNDLKRRVLAGLFAGAALCLAAPAVLAAGSPIPNGTIPDGGHFIGGKDAGTITPNGTQMDIYQCNQNAVIVWDKGFNVGANATVNFNGPQDGYNTLNYDKSNSMSQIYGTINANNNGNIYIVNPAGVEIGNSAQINVGSLYVSNKYLDDTKLSQFNGSNLSALYDANKTSDAVLMSLGNINASSVTFDGGRVVIDTERLKTGDEKMAAENIKVNTTDAGSVVIGYDAYDKENETYAGANDGTAIVTVNDVTWTKADGYMWVEDVEQLQKIDTNLGGNYALRNSIDATATQDWNDKKGFKPLGGTRQDGEDKLFTGKFDGLDYNIFNLNIKKDTDNVGLFGVVGDKAVINNVTLVGGSIKGQNKVGALAGQVSDGAQISNIMNSASVTGSSNVGGIIGSAGDSVFENLVNTGTVAGIAKDTENNAGGLIGSLTGGKLSGTSYNLGGVTGSGANVGGLVGTASNATLGDGTNLIYNRLNVSGKYNVGGIVGSMTNTTVKNAENSGNVTATGHTTEAYKYHTAHTFNDENVDDNGVRTETVNIANAGGIAGTASGGSKISDVQNSGDVSSGIDTKDNGGYTFYTAGNVGGIVGRAENTNITDATNTENDVRGAHNVGGIAGYFGSTGTENTDVTYTITRGVNNGGDILATGAVDKDTKESTTSNELTRKDGFITEYVRGGSQGSEQSIIGNIGGIAGYMYGDNVYIASSANRGTVHSQDIGTEVLPVNQAANAGGIVGKIDRNTKNSIEGIKSGDETAAVKDSYSTGDVRGYMGVGGVVGMMYNGAVSGSYNLGTVNTTRNQDSFKQGNYFAVNMGGIVGDTTEETDARAVLYDVYNKGQIGDKNFKYYARHVGGVVGRLSGTVEKAYNTGAIYNGYNIVGGIVGWLNAGSVTNSFNTGNITVLNHDNTEESNVGGIAGDVNIATGNIELTNVYNLGTLRSIQYKAEAGSDDKNGNVSVLGGIVGAIHSYHDNKNGKLLISNAYTTGNLYSDGSIKSIVTGGSSSSSSYKLTNTYYIRPADTEAFTPCSDRQATQIEFDAKDDIDQYKFDNGITNPSKDQSGNDIRGENVDENAAWRIYDGSTPILNAFLPNTENYFSDTSEGKNPMAGISSIQYGTAYDPLLTIINAANTTQNLTFDWQKLGANNAAGIAVYGAGLTLDNFKATGGSGYFGGMIYSDGALAINAHTSEGNTEVTGDVVLGSASRLYGSSVSISADGNVTIYGDVTATGNTKNGTGTDNAITDGNSGDISIEGGSVDIYGQLTSAKNAENENTTFIPGIGSMAAAGSWDPGDVKKPEEAMSDIGDRFGYTTGASTATGNISITANGKASEDGHVNVYYGHQQKGFLDTAKDLTVKASGDVYMDSDLSIGGSLSITAGADSEAVLDISNIGQVQAANNASQEESAPPAVAYLHDFLTHFASNQMTLSGGKQKIAVDMWGTDETFDLDKFDYNGTSLSSLLNGLNINGATDNQGQKYTYIWVSTGEELKNIQSYYDDKQDKTNILSYNFALKNDIDASAVTGYEAIGSSSDNGFTGTFDGRDHRIIGLNVTGSNAGIFDTIGKVTNGENTIVGKVEDLRVYSGNFNGIDNAGAVAGINNGNISNVMTFGNVVTAQGSAPVTSGDTTPSTQLDEQYVGAAGGIAGVNAGSIDNASASDAVTAADDGKTYTSILSTAGGIAGINQNTISNSSSNSAVNASAGSTYALGGITGVNTVNGKLSNVDSLGVTTGIYEVGSHNTAIGTQYSDNVGGIAGRNSGTISEAYNESIVSGRDNVGGILGVNKGTSVSNVANASSVTGEAGANDISEHVGGLVGANEGSITNGRNNGEITGNNYVGGLVGANGKDSTLTNLVNDESAAIIGDNYVGGIAGTNEGTISAENQDNLINRGTITGQKYVGGVAGENIGTIEYIKNDIDLIVRDPLQEAMYFGGVAGVNGRVNQDGSVIKDKDGNVLYKGTITSATNQANIVAPKADYVGGIVGWNTAAGDLEGMGNSNEGRVEGASHVGGVAGKNNADIAGTVASMIGIENSGVVIAHNGGAGGIFGENTGKIEYVDMTNKGTVSGTYSENAGMNGTGGIFGVNSGVVTHSSLKNEVGGQVMGTQNVGGLIGVNSGDITGGRTEEDGKDVGYYKYQIYNNGTIKAGTWTDKNQNGIVDEGELDAAKPNSQNIAGLFGINRGKVTAGYNTGAIHAGGSENVGGIAGTNAGKLDQVFNTVITGVNEDGANAYGSITGHTNVGGIAGTNTGTISNAYNTTAVTGINDTGSIAGSSTGIVENVYATVSGSLVGNGGVIKNDTGYVVTDNDQWKQSSSYNGFDFDSTDTDGTESIWKIYEGSTNPLLKVFLTKVTVNPDKLPDFAADGNEHKLNVGDLIQSGALTALGGIGFGAFGQNQNLIQSNGHSAMGTYYDWLYSMQIAASGEGGTFNPNLLGYDIDLELGIGLPPDTVEPPVNEHWNFLFDDNPWDRNRDFRERKAEVHYIAGGMTL